MTAGCSSAHRQATVVTETVHTTATTTVTTTVTGTPSAASTTAPATADLSILHGPWFGHTRQLSVSPSGVVSESVSDGCCELLHSVKLQLSNLTGTSQKALADAEVLAVHVLPGYPKSAPKPPAVGDKGTVTVDAGVFTDSWFGVTFCDDQQSSAGTCGA
jgi:hypothetical protein